MAGERRHDGTDPGMGRFDGGAPGQRALVLERLDHGEQFDRDDAPQEPDRMHGEQAGGRAHGVVVFDARTGRDVGDAGRIGDGLHLAHTRGGGVLGNHETTLQAGIFGEVRSHRVVHVVAGKDPVDATLGDTTDVTRGDPQSTRSDLEVNTEVKSASRLLIWMALLHVKNIILEVENATDEGARGQDTWRPDS